MFQETFTLYDEGCGACGACGVFFIGGGLLLEKLRQCILKYTRPSVQLRLSAAQVKHVLILAVFFLTMLTGVSAYSVDLNTGLDAYKRGDFATALREWIPIAEQGNASVQSNLGFMYENGQGVSKNRKTVVKWYLLSAKQGHTFIYAQRYKRWCASRLIRVPISRCPKVVLASSTARYYLSGN
jgi:hypothetical protein